MLFPIYAVLTYLEIFMRFQAIKKFSSHRKCKDKRFGYSNMNSYLVWIFSWNRRENYKTFCLIKWSYFRKRRISINSFKRLRIVFKYAMQYMQQNVKYLKSEHFFEMSLKIQSGAGFVRFLVGRWYFPSNVLTGGFLNCVCVRVHICPECKFKALSSKSKTSISLMYV